MVLVEKPLSLLNQRDTADGRGIARALVDHALDLTVAATSAVRKGRRDVVPSDLRRQPARTTERRMVKVLYLTPLHEPVQCFKAYEDASTRRFHGSTPPDALSPWMPIATVVLLQMLRMPIV